MRKILATLACWLGAAMAAGAAEVSVAVAANFTVPMQKIAARFAADTGHQAVLAFGSTGRFHAQVKNGAPFQVLLAADDETPGKLADEHLAVRGTEFVYAVGRLVLWSTRAGPPLDAEALRRPGRDDRLAIADPRVAPYGRAAEETLARLGVLAAWRPRLVTGESIAQAHQFVASGNVPLGFVALSQVMVDGRIAQGSAWIVPQELHAPIRQQAILLARGRDNPAAQALLQYLRGDVARAIIRAHGYMP